MTFFADVEEKPDVTISVETKDFALEVNSGNSPNFQPIILQNFLLRKWWWLFLCQ